jgi:undecaprenyl diphosphate synthase
MVYESEVGEAAIGTGTGDFGLQGPRHIGIIMDGNGRWAAERGLSRTQGHRRGVDAVRQTVRTAVSIGLSYLTLFSFSSENWSRPPAEVQFLFGLLRRFIRRDLAELHQNAVKITIIGERRGLPADLVRLLDEAERLTEANSGLRLIIAFNYGGRNEIVRAVRRIAEEVAAGRLQPGAITDATLIARLDTAGIPDPDLIIRTSGELRISNFLLWQSAYAEFVFLPSYWPDFDATALASAIDEYRRRKRRYGGLVAGGAR